MITLLGVVCFFSGLNTLERDRSSRAGWGVFLVGVALVVTDSMFHPVGA